VARARRDAALVSAPRHVVVIGGWAPSLIAFRGPLLAALRAAGHRVTAVAADGDAATTAALAAMGVAFEEVPLARAGLDPRADLRSLWALTAALRRLRPDVVLGYTIKPVIYGGLAGRLARVPRRYALITGLGYVFLGQDRLARRLLARGVAGLYRAGLGGLDGIFFQNPDDQADLVAAGAVPADVPATIVRGSGVDTDAFAVAPLPGGPIRFLFVGRLLREKGFADFVDMARRVRAEHPEATFSALGWLDPNPASYGQAELDAMLSGGDVRYLGETRDVRPFLADAHVLVLPSYREGTPRSVLEAMSVGRAIITTDVPGCRETIVDGEHGLLVPVRDGAALARAGLMLAGDRAMLARMATAARARAVELYDARAVAAHMLRVMELA
jgi:glycosyltransferase involved in cell wall biosynthesis